jgi:DNA primase
LRISQRSIEEVREAANLVEVASEFTALRRQGARFIGLCPYPDHQEKTPSFSVSPDRGFYYCFGCSRGGDAIKLVSELKSFSFVDAVSYLAERSGIELEFEGGADSEAARERILRRRNIHRALAAAAVYYHKYLLKSQSPGARHARDYLEARGITISTIEEFRLGYAPPRGTAGFVKAAAKLGFEREVLDAAGLLSARGGERFAGRITFPISDRRGRIVGFGARALGEDHPKYLNSPETEIFNKRYLLYGFPQVLDAIRQERAVLVVEGYTDVLMLYQSGIKNAIATLGTATTSAHLRTLSGYADRIYLLFDPDEAGERATQKVRAAAREAIDPEGPGKHGGVRGVRQMTVAAARMKLDLRVVRLTEDPADWLGEHRPEEFAELLAGAVPILEYVFRHKIQRLRDADTAERSRAMSEIRSFLREIRVEDPIFYQDAIRLAAETLGVNPEILEQGRAPAPPANPSQNRGPTSPLDRAGRELLALALAYPDLMAEFLRDGLKIRSLPEPVMLKAEDFGDDAQAGIFSLLQEHAGEGTDSILSDERAQPYLDLISALISEGTRDVIITDRNRRGEKVMPSRADAAQAWIGLKLLSCERAKRNTEDLDEKERIQYHVQNLKEALHVVSTEP